MSDLTEGRWAPIIDSRDLTLYRAEDVVWNAQPTTDGVLGWRRLAEGEDAPVVFNADGYTSRIASIDITRDGEVGAINVVSIEPGRVGTWAELHPSYSPPDPNYVPE